ncbi:complex I-MWFE [Caerostris darwini]|uniref:Complex I-MWFE n=1 Tax=Caerostris darwini TaxID=1538125 RepID=A0AAV4QM48_9ARAC|nr:complex I-MWFE [Caerostris darwini]
MWYEILPTLTVFGTFLMIPCYAPWFVNMAIRGKPHIRTAMDMEDRKLTMRDERLSGHIFKMKGLEQIPDPK